MSVTGTTVARITSVAIEPKTEAAELYRSARVAGFPADPTLNLERFPGRTIEQLTFTNVYLGGAAAWRSDDITQIDWALPAAMQDSHLNNVLAQYFPDGKPTTTFKPSRILDDPVPERVYRDTVETLVASLDRSGALAGFELASSVFCLLLPEGVVLVDGVSTTPNGVDSKHGLGGYHGSVHAKHGSKTETVYYAVCVYSDGLNGISVFPDAWKNTCAVFYHELCEARTDPDVEDAIRAGNSTHANDFLGWYSPRGGEIGDIPLEEAGGNLKSIMREVKLAAGSKTVPVQFMWSNAVAGPRGADRAQTCDCIGSGFVPTFELAIPTRWPDFDALGHLNQAVYHVFLDEARDDALRQTVGDFDTWPNVVVHTSIDYRHEIVRGTREVVVTTQIADVGRSSARFKQTVSTPEGEIAAEAEAVLVAWDPEARRSREITQVERERLTR